MRALLIAEKPSLMKEINDVYRNINHPDQIKFMSFAGHVVGLKNPRDYGVVNGIDWSNKSWNTEMIPMIPDEFLYQVAPDKKSMFNTLMKEANSGQYDYIINACDPDREGNHIFELFYRQSKCKLPVKRFWTNDLSFAKIEEALMNLRDDNDGLKPNLKNLTDAAILRAWSDWLFGMNFTIGVSLNMGTTVKIGRVKTATHMMLAKREDEIKNFKPKTTYELDALYKEGFTGTLFDQDGNVRFEKEKDADKILKDLGKTAIVEKVETKKETTNAPQLYKLSDLQTDGSKYFGYNADKVLATAQSLYEKKVLSYPRTDCRYLGTEQTKEFKTLLTSIATLPELEPYVKGLTKAEYDKVAKNKKYVNDAELAKSGHYALSPTSVKPNWNSLTTEEKNILTLVYKRFLAIFLPPMITNKTTVITNNNDYTFRTTGKELVDKGYTVIYGTNTTDNLLPKLKKGQTVNVDKFELKAKTTTCPPRYTQGTLIAAMENPAKFLEDETLKDIIKEKQGIGTPATRSDIIKSLINDNYVEEKKGKGKASLLYVTDVGMLIYENLKGEEFASVDMTGIWEEKLSKVAEGKLLFNTYNEELRKYVADTTQHIKELKLKKYRKSYNVDPNKIIGSCPNCGSDFLEGEKNFYCSDRDCDTSISKEILGTKITKTEVKKLIAGKETKELLFKKKDGTEFKSKLTYQNNKLIFGSGNKNQNTTNINCPICDKQIKDTGKFFICEDYKNPCSFCLSHEFSGAKFSIKDIEKMLNGERIKKKFTWKNGNTDEKEVEIIEKNGRWGYNIIF